MRATDSSHDQFKLSVEAQRRCLCHHHFSSYFLSSFFPLCRIYPSLSSLWFSQTLPCRSCKDESFLSVLPAFRQAGRGSGDHSDLSHKGPYAGALFCARVCLCDKKKSVSRLSCFVLLAEWHQSLKMSSDVDRGREWRVTRIECFFFVTACVSHCWGWSVYYLHLNPQHPRQSGLQRWAIIPLMMCRLVAKRYCPHKQCEFRVVKNSRAGSNPRCPSVLPD